MSIFKPFADADSLRTCTQYLDIPDFVNALKVNRGWKSALDKPHVWKNLTERMGIPFVASLDGHSRNYKADLSVLFPITLSGWQIAKTLGKPLGKTAMISEKFFLTLSEPDPFEPGKLIRETFQFVCTYSFVERTVEQLFPLTLDEFGELKVSSEEDCQTVNKTIKIPLSLKNQKLLSLFSLNKKETPRFLELYDEPAFDQCDSCFPKNSVYFMRKQVSTESKDKTFDQQLELIKSRSLPFNEPKPEITPIEVRALYSVVSTLTRKTSQTLFTAWTFARSPCVLYFNQDAHHVATGDFDPACGLCIDYSNQRSEHIGVAPGCSATT